jgi:hypothetical protein
LLHNFVLITNLAKDGLDLLEGVTRDHLLDALPQLSHSFLILSIPFFAHPSQLIFQSSCTLSCEINIFRELPQLQVILVVVVHFPEGCLAVKLVLGSLTLDLELAYFLVELGKTFNHSYDLVTAILKLCLSVCHFASPVLSQLLFFF